MLLMSRMGQRALGRTPVITYNSTKHASTSANNAAAVAAVNNSFAVNFYNPPPRDEDSRGIVPKYWTGKAAIPYEDFQIDCSKLKMDRIVQKVSKKIEVKNEVVLSDEMFIDEDFHETRAMVDEMNYKFNRIGAVQLINTGLTDMAAMEKVSKLVSGTGMVYEGGANLRGFLEKNVYDTGAPLTADIHYHHEMSYVTESTKWLSFLCENGCRDPNKGMTFISNNTGVTDTLMNNPSYSKLGNKLKEKGLCYIRKLPDRKYFRDNNLDSSIVYNYWQTSMQTEDMDEAVEVAKKMGLEVEWQDSPTFGRYMVTKFYVSAFEYDPYTDSNTLYSSIADDYIWFQSWNGVMNLPHWERPLKLNFGDDEVMTREEKQQFVDVYDAHGVPIYWRQGDISVICNFRTAHGRPGFTLEDGEKRELGVVLGGTFKRVGDLPDKW